MEVGDDLVHQIDTGLVNTRYLEASRLGSLILVTEPTSKVHDRKAQSLPFLSIARVYGLVSRLRKVVG
jgi:hypothetical protein